MGIATKLPGWWPWGQARPRARHIRSGATEHSVENDHPEAVILGCGWFDSSHDLRNGLVVIDGEAAELVVPVTSPG